MEVGATTSGGEGQITRYVYDARGGLRRVERKNAEGAFLAFSTFTSNSDGQRLSETDGENRRIVMQYDLLQRLTAMQDLATHRAEFKYDASGNRIWTKDAAGVERTFVYDGLDRLVRANEPHLDPAAITVHTYDAAGNLSSIRDANNHTTIYEYDGLSRLRSVTRPLRDAGDNPVTVIGYEYDLRGRLRQWTNGRKDKIVYGYETWGPVKTADHYLFGATTPDRTITYAYDLAANQLSVTDSNSPAAPLYQSVTEDYDALNRLERVSIGYLPGKSLSYSYDRFGNRSSVTLTEGSQTLAHSYQYNKFNQLEIATLPGSQTFQFLHLDNDDPDLVTHPSGLTTRYIYEAHGPLKSIAVAGAPHAVEALDFRRDTLDRVDRITETTAAGSFVWTYDYDNGGRLDEATYPAGRGLPSGEDLAYDLVGNREHPTNLPLWDYDANDRILASPARTYTHDSDGNVRTIGDGVATATLTYDIQNRLVRYERGTTSASYAYDPLGRRIKKSVGSTERWYLWDGDRLLAEYDASGNRVARYAYAKGFAPIQFATGAGASEAIYDVHADHLETPRLLTNVSKTVVWRVAYEAFGNVIVDENPDGDGTGVSLPLRFAGQYADPASEGGFYYNRSRVLDPTTGRYLSADPIGQSGGLNLYRYVFNNPINMIDPTGLCPFSFWDQYRTPLSTMVDLGAVGLLDRFRNSTSVSTSVNNFKKLAFKTAESTARSACGKSCGTVSESFTLDEPDVTDVTTEPCLFAVGNSIFSRRADCGLEADCAARFFEFECSLDFSISDYFIDALDPIDVIPGNQDLPGGATYPINANWSDQVSGAGSF